MPASDFNPHAAEYAAIESRLETFRSELDPLEEELGWFAERSSESIQLAIQLAEEDLATARDHLRKIEGVQEGPVAGASLARYMARQPLMGQEKRKSLDRLHVAEQELRDARAMLSRAEELVTHREIWLEDLQSDQRKFAAFDPSYSHIRRKELMHAIRAAEEEREKLQPEHAHIQTLIAPLVPEFDSLEQRGASLRDRVSRAKRLAEDLEHSNPRGRALAHGESEDLFGDPIPARVVRSATIELRAVERNLGKLQRRVQSIVSRATRSITSLVIDGNNLCYQDREFCGLAPLQALVPILVQAYTVLVVFDASIRRRLALSDQAIAAQLEGAPVHIVASKQGADQTLLDLAGEEGAYILSNDRFGEYPDKSVVREQRLIRHEIVAGRIFIHDLEVEARFGLKR